MIPRLQAEEMLSAITVGAIISPNRVSDDGKAILQSATMTSAQANDALRAIHNQKDGTVEVDEKKPRVDPATLALKFAAMGIGLSNG